MSFVVCARFELMLLIWFQMLLYNILGNNQDTVRISFGVNRELILQDIRADVTWNQESVNDPRHYVGI